MKIAFDLDGTLAKPWWVMLSNEEIDLFSACLLEGKLEPKEEVLNHLQNNVSPYIHPKKSAIIITSRPTWTIGVTGKWLSKFNYDVHSLIMAPKCLADEVDRAYYKAIRIMEYGIEVYYEDEERLREHIKNHLDNFYYEAQIHAPLIAVYRGDAFLF